MTKKRIYRYKRRIVSKKILNDLLIGYTEVGNLKEMKYLIKCGANICYKNDYVFRIAARKGYLEIVKYLMKENNKRTNIYDKIDIEIKHHYAIRWSSRLGHYNVVKFLLDLGCYIPNGIGSPVYWAVRNNHFKIFRLLLDNGATYSSHDYYVLYYATQYNRLDVVKYLLRLLNYEQRYINKVVEKAMVYKRTNILKYLLVKKYDCSIISKLPIYITKYSLEELSKNINKIFDIKKKREKRAYHQLQKILIECI